MKEGAFGYIVHKPAGFSNSSSSMSDLLVLCYHAVSPRWQADLSITPEALER